jgi:hypothetical protein
LFLLKNYIIQLLTSSMFSIILLPTSSIMTPASAFSANLTNDKHMQINGIGADQGRVAILNITANFKYAGQIKYDIG